MTFFYAAAELRFLRIVFTFSPTAANENIIIIVVKVVLVCRAVHCTPGYSAGAGRLHGGTGTAIIDIVDVCIRAPQLTTQYSTALHCTADKTLITLGNNLIVAMIYFSIITTHYVIVFFVTDVLIVYVYTTQLTFTRIYTGAFIS